MSLLLIYHYFKRDFAPKIEIMNCALLLFKN